MAAIERPLFRCIGFLCKATAAGTLFAGLITIGSSTAQASGQSYLVSALHPQDSGSCTTWATACTLSYALTLEAATPGTICMKVGTYSDTSASLASDSVINTTDLSSGNDGVTILGGYQGKGAGCGQSAPRGSTTLQPGTLVGNGIIDLSANNSVTIEKLTVDSTKVSYAPSEAPILNSGGSNDVLGLAPLNDVVVSGGAPAVAVELTGGSTKLRGVNISNATRAGVLCSGPSTGCTITGSKVTGSRSSTGIVFDDVSGQTLGGSSTALGDLVTGNGVGIAVTDGSSGNVIEHDKVKGNFFFGVMVSGVNAFPELGETGETVTSNTNSFSHNSWSANGSPVSGQVNGGANVIDFSGFSTTGDVSIGGTAPTLASSCLTIGATVPPFNGGTLSLVDSCAGRTPEKLGPGTLIDISGATNANGDNVSFFVTAPVTVGSSPTNASVEPLIPVLGSITSTTSAGTGVTANGQTAQLSKNSFGSGNSCNPAAPNTSVTLTDGTGGGAPGSTAGGETGYLAC